MSENTVVRPAIATLAVCVCLQSAPLENVSISAILSEPARFELQTVTLVGEFRGRLLDAESSYPPSDDRHAFLLKAGNASIWVMELEPRGPGWALDPANPADVGRWVRVTGRVIRRPGRVWLRGTHMAPVSERSTPVAIAVTPPRPPDPIAVVFTAPIHGEADVRLTTRIRIQLSDDILPATLKERIRVTYSKSDSVDRGEAQPPAIVFAVNYAQDPRAIEIIPSAPLERFREVTVELLEGIEGRRGGGVTPWRMSFNTGGS